VWSQHEPNALIRACSISSVITATCVAIVLTSASDLTIGPNGQPLFSGYRYGAITPTGLSIEEVHDGSIFMSNSNSSIEIVAGLETTTVVSIFIVKKCTTWFMKGHQ
jgi:hypothetical protein